uniref:Neuromedin S n=1 Tax=Bos mutus grunniens TaxID=30521 RepID=A0A8B9Z068_BOSMU
MKYLAQFPSILAIYCFCLLQIPSSGFPRPLADASDGLDIVKFEVHHLKFYVTSSLFSFQDNQDIYKRFLFHYSRTQEPAHPVKTGFPPVHPLMRLAAKLADRRMKTFWRRPDWVTVCVFILQDYTATLGRPFFLFRVKHVSSFLFFTLILFYLPHYGVITE